MVDLHMSGSSLGAISKHLKVPRSSVQTIVRVQINPSTTAKDLVKMLEETGTKVSISTVKLVLYLHNLKGHSARKKPLLQYHHKNARLRFATVHGDEIGRAHV